MTEQLEISGLTFDVRRSHRRKTLGMTVDRAGELVLHAPVDVSSDELQAWAKSKLLWVHQKLAEKKKLVGRVQAPEFVSGESVFYLGRSYRLRVVRSAQHPLSLIDDWFVLRESDIEHAACHFEAWFIEHGAKWLVNRSKRLERQSARSPRKVVVKDLGFRWGSCTRSGAVYFNWRLLQLPVRLIDYVVLHEHVHLRHHNHSRAFWTALEEALPDWKTRKEELETDWSRYSRFARASGASVSDGGKK